VDEGAAPLNGRGQGRLVTLGLSLLAGLAALLLGSAVESRIMRYARPEPGELEWISDVIVAAAVVSMTYLWLHLRASRSRVATLERQQIALDEELRLAAHIQQSLLPVVPPSTRGFEWSARMVPARRVGGDFYDFVVHDDGSVLAILGDVSGKGIPAALMQSALKTLFRAVAGDGSDPARVAERMGAALRELGGESYATAVLARFEHTPPRLTFVSAGHPPGVLVQRDGVRQLSAGGPPLGLLPGSRYESEQAALQPEDLGVFVTDGITEALEGVPLTLEDALHGLSVRAAPVARLADALMDLAARSPGPPGVEGWQDDRTVFAFRVAAQA